MTPPYFLIGFAGEPETGKAKCAPRARGRGGEGGPRLPLRGRRGSGLSPALQEVAEKTPVLSRVVGSRGPFAGGVVQRCTPGGVRGGRETHAAGQGLTSTGPQASVGFTPVWGCPSVQGGRAPSRRALLEALGEWNARLRAPTRGMLLALPPPWALWRCRDGLTPAAPPPPESLPCPRQPAASVHPRSPPPVTHPPAG